MKLNLSVENEKNNRVMKSAQNIYIRKQKKNTTFESIFQCSIFLHGNMVIDKICSLINVS